jgi:circadian clock protein KaiC
LKIDVNLKGSTSTQSVPDDRYYVGRELDENSYNDLVMAEVSRTLTGLEGFDDMIGGGIPSGRVLLVQGGPGTGKTTLAIQYLVNGVLEYGEKGIFVSFDQPKYRILQEAMSHGWNLEKFCNEERIAFIDGSPFTRMNYRTTGFKVPLQKIYDDIKNVIHTNKFKRISVDTLAALTLQFTDTVQRREIVLGLFEALSNGEVASIVTDAINDSEKNPIMLEEYLADGLIILRSSQVERRQIRMIEVKKMRGSAINEQIRPYVLNRTGFSVLSDKDVFAYAAGLLIR